MTRQQLAVAEAQPLALEHVVVEVGDDAARTGSRPRRRSARSSQGTSCAPKPDRKKIGIAGNVITSGSSMVARSMNDSTISTPREGEVDGEARQPDRQRLAGIGGDELPATAPPPAAAASASTSG